MSDFDKAIKKIGSKKTAKKMRRRMKRTGKAFDRFNDVMEGGKKSGGGSPRGSALQDSKRTRRGKRGRGKKGGDGGGPKPTTARSTAQDFIKNALTNTVEPTLDSKFEDERVDLQAALEGSRGKLFDLDPETQRKFEEKLRASQMMAERGFATQRDSLITRLFGKGRTEGELASQMGGRLIGDQELVKQQIRADDATAQLQTQFHLGDQNLQNLGMQLGSLEGGRAAALQTLALQQQERGQNLGAATGLETTGMQTDAQRYSADQALAGARASAAASVKSASIHAAASRANAMASLSASKYSTNAGLLTNMMGMEQSNRHFSQDLGFRNRSLDLNADLTREGYANQVRLAEMSQPSTTDKILGFAGGLLGGVGAGGGGLKAFFSDERMKSNIRVIPDAVTKVQQLDGVLFEWLGSPDAEDGGVIAQQVEKVLPELVETMEDGFKTVNYNGLIGLLIQAVKELSDG